MYLKKAAEIGIFSDNEKELTKLPGVGKYTARAILVFAFNKNVAAVDTNIRQIITHYFFKDTIQKPSVIQSIADQLVPVGKSWEWHQALMDYGALIKLPLRHKQKAVPFKQSHRYYRGRIMDLLREKERKERELLSYLARTYEKHEQFFRERIDDLIKEGLVERSKYDIVHLPR